MKATAPTNDVYGNPDQNFRTPCIYFYYLTESNLPELNTRAYFIQRQQNITDIEAEIASLIKDVQSNAIKPCGWALGDIRWRHLSYFVLVFDDPSHKLYEKNAVKFVPYHPFKGGNDYRALSAQGITAFYCENHLEDSSGTVLADPSSPEYFKVVANHDGHSMLSVSTHNDTGTNMGPPIPPP